MGDTGRGLRYSKIAGRLPRQYYPLGVSWLRSPAGAFPASMPIQEATSATKMGRLEGTPHGWPNYGATARGRPMSARLFGA